MPDKVLIVDDDPGIRTTISELIQELGYSAETASDGLAAVGLLDSARFLRFTDIMMPNMSAELIVRIRPRMFASHHCHYGYAHGKSPSMQ